MGTSIVLGGHCWNRYACANIVTMTTESIEQAVCKMNIESWCRVEGNSDEKWTRAERKHEENAFKSSVFDTRSSSSSEERMEWCTTTKPKEMELDKLAKRRHFKQKCEHRTLYKVLYKTLIISKCT